MSEGAEGTSPGSRFSAPAIDSLLAGALFLSAFFLYAVTASRTIFVGDSGELVTAVHVLGIPHPSGYPLYVLLGKLWTLLVPLGSVAFRMSLFSAAAGAGTVVLLYRVARALRAGRPAALFAGMLLAVAPSFRGEANIQRVYTLNALFVAIVVLFAVRWFRDRRDRDLVIAFFAAGLGATNHTFMAVVVLALAMVTPLADWSIVSRMRTIAAAAVAFAAGLLPYAFLPIRSRQDPPLDWGNPETWEAFVAVVTRRDFWPRRWWESPADLWPISTDWLRSLVVEGGWVAVPLALIALGVVVRPLIRPSPSGGVGAGDSQTGIAFIFFALAVMAGNVLAMALHGSKSDLFLWHRYYVPAYLMLALLAALGLQRVTGLVPRRARYLPLLVPLVLAVAHHSRFDRSRFRIAEDYSRTLLASLPPGATLVASDDNILFVLIYLHLVEGLRPDIDLIQQGVAEGTPPRLRFDPDVDAIFFTHHPNWRLPQLELVPAGLVYRVQRAGRPRPPVRIVKTRLDGEDDPRVPKDELTQNLIGEFHFMLGVTFEKTDWAMARRQFVEAASRAPVSDALHYNLGLLYGRNGMPDRAAASFRHADRLSPRGMASSSERAARARGTTIAREGAMNAEREVARLRSAERALTARDPALRSLRAQSPQWHQRMASLLEASGEPLFARGHRLRAVE